ncbi:M16 family metallopeptidase [Candidatus Amarolinea aalborgensis]|jgi:zinc protease|uniref:M16 family metallopeptidase n=1 Tax=Candidatus Amarolinea aalborgensis TaxID=2249329 RepID=UPI003BF9FF09
MNKLAVPDSTSITRQRLSNGLIVLVHENHTNPSVVVSGYLRGGSLLETPAQSGLASFTASMLRRGTANRSFADINETLEAVGASFGVGSGRHITDFNGKCLREDLPLLLDIMTDILRHPTFPEEHVEKVRGQILTGLQERDNDTRSMASLTFRQLLYGADHPYGRSLSGERETVLGLTRQNMLDFYHRTYSPADGALVIVGDVQTDSLLAQLEQLLGNWERPTVSAALPPVAAPNGIVERRVAIAGKTQTDIVLGWLGPERNDPDYYAAALANTILGRFGMMGRLGENVREKQGLAYYAYSAVESGEGPGSWMAVAGVNPANVERTISSVLEEIVRLRDELIPEDELADSQAFMTGILPLRLETNQGVADTISDMERFNLGLDFLDHYPTFIKELTAAQLQAAVHRFLDPANYALGIAGPPAAA